MIRIAVVLALWHRRALAGVVLRHMARMRDELRAEQITLDLVAVASNREDGDLARDSGWTLAAAANDPLAAKWAEGLRVARALDPDAVVILGSDDIIHADVLRCWARRLSADPGPYLLGLSDCHVYRPADERMVHWQGYPEGSSRAGESIGSGRCLSRALLDALGWQPWDVTLNQGLDASMRARVRRTVIAVGDPVEYAVPMAEAGWLLDVKHDDDGVSIGSWNSMRGGSVPVDAEIVLAQFPAETVADLARSCDPLANAPRLWEPCAAPLVSAALILRDEAASIGRCLRSLGGVVDEVVVILDTATTDRTGEIAAAMGARVIERAWTADFAAARNASLDACRGRWRVIIDGDEVLVDPADLRSLMETETDADGIDVLVTSEDGTATRSQASCRVLGPAIRYRYPAHNEPHGFTHRILSGAVFATSYEGVLEEHAARTIPMLLAMTEDPQWDGDAHAPYHLAQTYAALQRWPEALRWADRSIEISPRAPEHAASWGVRARALTAERRTSEALRTMAEGLAIHGQGPAGGYADLWRFLTTMGVAGWCGAAAHPGQYAFVPQEGLGHAARLPEAAEMLGLPLRFRRGTDAA